MKFPFPFNIKKKDNKDRALREITAQFSELQARFIRLEQSLNRQDSKSPHISIQNVHIHHPVLKSLEFRLDGLDIENLSGSLNLGNNIGAKTGLERFMSPEKTQYKPDDAAAPNNGSQTANETSSALRTDFSGQKGLHRTPFGFRFSRN
ncbi:hypothetical protein D7Z26_13500 [Cohnella endophytica]|uniref:Uncharacterized protein n=1 Tax=Cohnella endophytica TaxID=2419778 RepID=A0A494Y1P9_9BACL|nr:hypothetical protein [Cohnella endophytica]RKP54367.1 hypothetical protein D7Z26_13500 [Cohnella endophytica]